MASSINGNICTKTSYIIQAFESNINIKPNKLLFVLNDTKHQENTANLLIYCANNSYIKLMSLIATSCRYCKTFLIGQNSNKESNAYGGGGVSKQSKS